MVGGLIATPYRGKDVKDAGAESLLGESVDRRIERIRRVRNPTGRLIYGQNLARTIRRASNNEKATSMYNGVNAQLQIGYRSIQRRCISAHRKWGWEKTKV